jgi:hypothetical protein
VARTHSTSLCNAVLNPLNQLYDTRVTSTANATYTPSMGEIAKCNTKIGQRWDFMMLERESWRECKQSLHHLCITSSLLADLKNFKCFIHYYGLNASSPHVFKRLLSGSSLKIHSFINPASQSTIKLSLLGLKIRPFKTSNKIISPQWVFAPF